LVQGGTSPSGQGKPLVRLLQIDQLRVYFPLGANFVARVHAGDPADVRLDSGRVIHATVSHVSDEVSLSTRTMMVEVDVKNDDFSIIPGMYATAVLKPEHRENVVVVPIQAVNRKS